MGSTLGGIYLLNGAPNPAVTRPNDHPTPRSPNSTIMDPWYTDFQSGLLPEKPELETTMLALALVLLIGLAARTDHREFTLGLLLVGLAAWADHRRAVAVLRLLLVGTAGRANRRRAVAVLRLLLRRRCLGEGRGCHQQGTHGNQ